MIMIICSGEIAYKPIPKADVTSDNAEIGTSEEDVREWLKGLR